MRKLVAVLISCSMGALAASPVLEFGYRELERAFRDRNPGRNVAVAAEISADLPESFRIVPGRILGGDLRGLLYGLLEASDQVRTRGRMVATRGQPAWALRSVVQPFKRGEDQRSSLQAYWNSAFAFLSRARINRLKISFEGHPESLNGHEALSAVCQQASNFALDLAVAVGMEELVAATGTSPQQSGPASLLVLKALLTACPPVRAVEVSYREAVRPWQDEFLRNWILRALSEAGRRVVLELPAHSVTPELAGAMAQAGLPYRLLLRSGEAYPQVPARGLKEAQIVCLVKSWEEQFSNPGKVRDLLKEYRSRGCTGFELLLAPAVSASEMPAVYLWGRLGYNPATPGATLPKGGWPQ